MVCTLIDHRNDVINVQNPSGTTSRWRVVSLQSFEHFYGVISMIYKSVDHGKLWSICFCTITFIFHQLLKNRRWRVVSLQSFEHFYGVISMIYKSVDHGKLWSICFCTITFIFHQLLQVVLFQPREATFFLLFFVFLLYLCSFKHQLTHRNFYQYVKIWFFFVHVEG